MATHDDHLCSSCRQPLDRAWVVGERTGALEQLVNQSKFGANRRSCRMQASLLDKILPQFMVPVHIVPIPTIQPHIRQRGFAHAELIARTLAVQRSCQYDPLLRRITTTVQHGASRAQRLRQAAEAFAVSGPINSEAIYLLVDDVCTTGASLQAAATQFRHAGARQVWAAVTTRQMLDD